MYERTIKEGKGDGMKIVTPRFTVTANTIFSVNDRRKLGDGRYTMKQQIVHTEGRRRATKARSFRDPHALAVLWTKHHNNHRSRTDFLRLNIKSPTGRAINARPGKDTILIASAVTDT